MLRHHPLRGAVFESFVVSELTKAFANAGEEAPLYHWRDATGHEIDVIVDLGDRQIPVEVKSGMTVASDAFGGLAWWTSIPSNPAPPPAYWSTAALRATPGRAFASGRGGSGTGVPHDPGDSALAWYLGQSSVSPPDSASILAHTT